MYLWLRLAALAIAIHARMVQLSRRTQIVTNIQHTLTVVAATTTDTTFVVLVVVRKHNRVLVVMRLVALGRLRMALRHYKNTKVG